MRFWKLRVRCVMAFGAFVAALGIVVVAAEGAYAEVKVRGYTRKDGTYVKPHRRSDPDGNFANNWSTYGNRNPYTGEIGKKHSPSSPSGSGGAHYGAYVGAGDSHEEIANPYFSALPTQAAPIQLVAHDAPFERLGRPAALNFRGVGFETDRASFLAGMGAARKVDRPDLDPRVSHYALRDPYSNVDVVSFMYLDDRLMSLSFIFESDEVRRRGGPAALTELAARELGEPAYRNLQGCGWSFPADDCAIVVGGDEKLWTLSASRLSVAAEAPAEAVQAEDAAGPLLARPTEAPTTPRGKHVSRAEYGDRWPLTVDEGYVESIGHAVVFHDAEGRTYALNGIARGTGKYLEIDPIWLPHPEFEGMRVNIGPLIDAGIATRQRSGLASLRSAVELNLAGASGTRAANRPSARPVVRSSSRENGASSKSDFKQLLADVAAARLKGPAQDLLPAARTVARLSAKDNAAAERYLREVVRPIIDKEPSLTDQSFAADGLCQLVFDFDGEQVAGQIVVTARDDGYEHVSVNMWPE